MQKKSIACLSALAGLYIFLTVGGSVSQTLRPGEASFRNGMVWANQYECVRAIAEFDKAIRSDPANPRYYTSRANCSLRQLANTSASEQDEEEAKGITAVIDGDLSTAIKADPKFVDAYIERAAARRRLVVRGKAGAALALQDFDRALELDPENGDVLRERAHFLLIDLKDEKRGLEAMDVLLKREPKESAHLFVRGRYFASTSRFTEAVRDLTAAITLSPDEYFYRILRADVYAKTKNYQAALDDLTHMLNKEPDYAVNILQMRAQIYRKQGKVSLALADERKAKALEREMDRELDKLVRRP